MRAIRLSKPGGALVACEVPVPAIGTRDVLVSVKAAGICHSDAHYRAGRSAVAPLPLTLGHEVAGVVAAIGHEVTSVRVGDRVCLHYLATCGECAWCQQGQEQFCHRGEMIGKHRDGGYAEFIAMPARSVFRLPQEIPFEQGAILMCSAATSLHALNQARLQSGETVAIFGVGGLGISAVQLARAFGARSVFAVDIKPAKLRLAAAFGAVTINGAETDPVAEIRGLTDGRGVDVALELIGLPATMRQCVQCLAIKGRAALVGITERTFEVAPYQELINKEASLIGVSDHLSQELPRLLELARLRKLDLTNVVSRTVPLEADAINQVLDQLETFAEDLRVVICP